MKTALGHVRFQSPSTIQRTASVTFPRSWKNESSLAPLRKPDRSRDKEDSSFCQSDFAIRCVIMLVTNSWLMINHRLKRIFHRSVLFSISYENLINLWLISLMYNSILFYFGLVAMIVNLKYRIAWNSYSITSMFFLR